MSNLNNDLAAIMSQGETTNKFPKKEDQKFTNSELLKKYFVPRLEKGQTSAQFRIRILKNPVGGSPFNQIKFHQVKVGPQWKKFLCLDELGMDCPLCDTATGYMAEGDKEGAKPWRASDFYVVRVLDRAKENEGVKFWRFKKSYKKTGEFDKILANIELGYDILDPSAEGYDLIIQCGLNDRGNSVVTNIACVKPSALAETEEKAQQLINDDTSWKDVFKPQTTEYLEDVVAGRAQYWDDNLKQYVKPGQSKESEEQSAPVDNVKTETPKLKDNPLMKDEKISEENIILSEEDDEDLPF